MEEIVTLVQIYRTALGVILLRRMHNNTVRIMGYQNDGRWAMTISRRRVHPIIIVNIGNIWMALVGRLSIIKHSIVIMYRGVILLVASMQWRSLSRRVIHLVMLERKRLTGVSRGATPCRRHLLGDRWETRVPCLEAGVHICSRSQSRD